MVIYNAATRELTAKIVYYGPGLCGKTTNLKVLHDRLEPGTAGKLLNLQTQSDRTIYFDLLPVELGDIKGYKIRFQLATVPGQTAFNETRRVVLKGVDGVVFVADSQWTMLPKNLESWQNLKDNLKVNAIGFESVPIVVQYNKRDLGDILAVDAMQEALGLSSYPFVEAVASAGRGVTETFKLISKLTFVDLLRRLQGRRAEEASLPTPEEAASADDLQTWKDSLLHRDSQPAVPVSRPSRPLSLVPPVNDEAPFDTTELARGVDDEDEDASPYEVRAPIPEAEPAAGEPPPPSSASTIRMEAVRLDEPAERAAGEPASEYEEPAEILSPADEVGDGDHFVDERELEASAAGRETQTDPSFLPPDTVRDERIELLERRLREMDDRSSAAGHAAERLQGAVASLESQVAGLLERLGGMAGRMQDLEHGVSSLQQALSAASERIAPAEDAIRRHGDLEAALRRLEAGLVDADERFLADQNRQRKDADDIAMALRGLTERAQVTDDRLGHLHQAAGSHEEALASHRGEIERLRTLEAQVEGLRGAAERVTGLESAVAALHDAAERVSGLEGAMAGVHEVAERLRTLEGRVSGVEGLAERTPALEDQISSLRAVLERVPALESELSALRDAGDRLPGVEQRAETLHRELRELESTLEEKTHQGRREAEDIRSQIAPLLEERVRRHESDALLFSEMERLRESLAESLHDIAERVRTRVRE
jgi:signal recognition particle receptor subunit beta/predicted  nucleic acid-binding Zn-ribbon protein